MPTTTETIQLPVDLGERIEAIKALLDDMTTQARAETDKARAAAKADGTDPVLAIEAKRQKAHLALADLQPNDPRYEEVLNEVSALDHAITRTAATTADGLRAQVDALARHHAGNAVEADQIETLRLGIQTLNLGLDRVLRDHNPISVRIRCEGPLDALEGHLEALHRIGDSVLDSGDEGLGRAIRTTVEAAEGRFEQIREMIQETLAADRES